MSPDPHAARAAAARRRARCASSPLGGLGEVGRNMTVLEYDGKLLDRRLRRALPRGAPARRRPDPARLRLHPRPARRHRRRSCSPTATRTTSAPCPTCCGCAQDIPLIGSQLTLALVEAKLKEHRITPYTLTVREGQREQLGPFDLRVHRGQPLDPGRARRRHPDPGRHWCCTPATSRWTSCRSTAGITDLRAFARLGEEGVDLFMVDSTNAEVPGFTAAERDIGPVLDRVFAEAPAPGHRRVLLQPRAPRAAGARRRATRTAARSPSSAARWCATWAIAARPRLPARCPTACWSTSRRLDDLPDDQIVYMCTGSQGEPMAVLSRMANRDHQIEVGRGRHRHPRLEPDPRQRERGLPGDQRADQARREGRAQGQRQGARLRARQRGRAALLLQHRPAAQRDAGARRVPPPRRERATSRSTTGVPRERVDLGRGRHRRRPDGRRRRGRRRGRRRLRLRRRLDASARSPRPTSRTAGSSARRASSRSSSWSTRVTGKVVAGPEIHARGFAEDDAVFDDVLPADRRRRWPRRGATGTGHLRSCSRSSAASSAAGSASSYRRRPMIIPVVIEA